MDTKPQLFLRHTHRLLNIAERLQNPREIETAPPAEVEEDDTGDVFENRFLIFFFLLWNITVGAHLVPVLLMRIRRQERCDFSLFVRMLCIAPAITIGVAIPIMYGYSKDGVAGLLIVSALTIFVPYLGWFMCITRQGEEENPLLACFFCCRGPLYPPIPPPPTNIHAITSSDDFIHNATANSTLYKTERELLILNTVIVCKVLSATDSETCNVANESHEEGVEIANDDDDAEKPAQDEIISNSLDDVDITKDRLEDMKESTPTKTDNIIPNPPSTETDETIPSDNEVSNYQDKSDIILPPKGTCELEDNMSIRQCYICLEEYQPGDEIAWSQNPACRHAFHKDCLVGWLMSHAECPVCRNTYDYEEELRA